MTVCKESWEFGEWLLELDENLPRDIMTEVLRVVGEVLLQKWPHYQKLQTNEMMDLIPRMQRIWGDEGEEQVHQGGWKAYQDIDYTDISKMSTENIESIAEELHRSGKLPHLTTGYSKDGFTEGVSIISHVAYLTVGGLVVQEGESESFETALRAVGVDRASKKTKLQ